MTQVDSVLLVAFGGPEKPEDVMPFLRNVTRGRNVPDDRLAVVADQYLQFGGKSPINDQNRALIERLRAEMESRSLSLPVYWGNRNWYPFLEETVAEMARDGRRRAVAIVTSAYSSYSSCRQYRENISAAVDALPSDLVAPSIEKIGQFYDFSGFRDPFVDGVRDAYDDSVDAILFTAHSVPLSYARSSRYEDQLRRTAQFIVEQAGATCAWDLVFQSRSGAPHVPWLEPDINDRLRALSSEGVKRVIVVPIGFVSDHQEVIFDLDFTAMNTASEVGVELVRVSTPGVDKRFVSMFVDMIQSHIDGVNTLRCLGETCCIPTTA